MNLCPFATTATYAVLLHGCGGKEGVGRVTRHTRIVFMTQQTTLSLIVNRQDVHSKALHHEILGTCVGLSKAAKKLRPYQAQAKKLVKKLRLGFSPVSPVS